jgi:large subunit ribosomal protein L10
MKTREERQQSVDLLSEEFRQTPNLVVMGYQGLTVSKDWDLRRKLQQANIKLRVVKNTLAERAAHGTPVEALSKYFKGMTAVALSKDDPVSLAKILIEFAKDNAQVQFRGALVEGTVISAQEIEAVSKMPSKAELLSKIMFMTKAPTQALVSALSGVARNLVVVLGQIRDKKKESDG